MIANNLVKSFPFAAKYFSSVFSSQDKRFPQSIVFEGLDVYAQFFFTLELARVLNCLQDADENCDCLNCKWIREGKHPAINFISQLHYKGTNDDSKTVISVAQAKSIEKALNETSDYHRFFVFFDAKPAAPDKNALQSIEKFSPQGYEVFSDFDWSIGHISQKTFNPAALNVLLKSVEEPPSRTTFVFLTKNRADLLNTIVSRSQCFKLPSLHLKNDISYISLIFSKYPDVSLQDAFSISENLLNYTKENEISSDMVLDYILEFLTKELKNTEDTNRFMKIKNDINLVSQAKRQIASSIVDKIVFETLMLKMARGKM